MDYELLIFDCDGVLVDSEPISTKAHKIAYKAHGLDLSDALMSRCVGMKQKDIIALIAKETGIELPESGVPIIWREVERLIREELHTTDGITGFLEASKIKRCVASSSAMERIQLSLQVTKLDRLFDPKHIFNSAMVLHGKPAPDLFLHAAAQCNAKPQRCAVFEDSVYGIRAAIAANMAAYGYIGGSHCTFDHADRLRDAGAQHIFSSWAEAQAHFASRP